ncbi:MAG TPA: 50S ribosomal protein L17 [Armatimonadota bacterium]|jgi:large subunit ribosomal protein L17|nr:50S ribosomal protein L17 [Armatimonadota bacterium]
MRHRKDHRKLNRATDQRLALLKGLCASLFRHDKIETTLPKAKEARRLADKLITLAKRDYNQLAARRQVLKYIPDPGLVKHLFDEIAPRFTERPGGYTRIIRAGMRRGDGAQMAILELVD